MSAVRANCKNVVFRLTNVCKVPGVGMLRLRGVGATLDATPLSMTVWSSAAIEREIRFFRSYGAWGCGHGFPTACALGCNLSPLRGLRDCGARAIRFACSAVLA